MNKCPICGRKKSHHIEVWNFQWVEVWAIACEECLGMKEIKKNKRIA